MARKVLVNNPEAGQGTLLEVPALGLFENGVEKEVTDDQVQNFRDMGFTFPESGTLIIGVDPKAPKPAPTPVEAPSGGDN